EQQADAVLAIPGEVVQYDVFETLLAGQYRGEQDAVVIRVRLGTEHRDGIKVGGGLEQFLERANTGHAIADHHQYEFLHAILRERWIRGVTPRSRQGLRLH